MSDRGANEERGPFLDLILIHEDLIGKVKIKGSFGWSGHEMVEFRILR